MGDWQWELPTTTTIKQRYQHLLSHKHRECQSVLCVCRLYCVVLCCVRLVGGASLQPPDEDGVGVQVMSEIYVFCLAAICSAAASPSPSRSLSLSPCDNKTKQNLRLDGSYDGGMGEW